MGHKIDSNVSDSSDFSNLILPTGQPRKSLPKIYSSLDKQKLGELGFGGIELSEPSEKIKEDLKRATKFRLLISRIREYETWADIFKEFAKREDTEEIQLLLGQPFCEPILLREKTLERATGITRLSDQIFSLLKNFIVLRSNNPTLDKKLKIKLFLSLIHI